ncbi:MAG TPA: metalloregulator ArsR/SmtB family transcription factor [Solirubrobacteraceae bacterium]|nr:metalloregulator ArsR/SmtB family transcription factor [Solirubrobacteraceae bacterium]
MSDQLGTVFAALSDPTRRRMLDVLMLEGMTSVPRLTGELPITRQAVAKHLAALSQAGLIERADGDRCGREVRYQLTPHGLRDATDWLVRADAAWEQRLARLKREVEGRVRP